MIYWNDQYLKSNEKEILFVNIVLQIFTKIFKEIFSKLIIIFRKWSLHCGGWDWAAWSWSSHVFSVLGSSTDWDTTEPGHLPLLPSTRTTATTTLRQRDRETEIEQINWDITLQYLTSYLHPPISSCQGFTGKIHFISRIEQITKCGQIRS